MNTRYTAEMLVRQKAKLGASLALRPLTESFILHKAQVRQCFNYFKEFPEKRFDKNMFTGSL